MKEDFSLTTERIDDFVVLLAIMQQMDLPGILDRHIARHWLQQGLSWGWTASIWLAHIVSQGDHRKLTVRDWVRQAHSTLEQVTGLDIRETDFTDDRLTIVLRHLSDVLRWQAIEQELGQHLLRVYDLEEQPIRVDATTVSGYRDGGEESLWQFGHSKDDPTLRQIKAMMATFLVDAYSRRLLAVYLTFDPPSYRSVMMVLRVCVRRLGRLPQMLVVDGGKEFRSRYFEALVNTYSCHKKYRPWAKPRYGAVIERLFGTTNTKFVFNLQGNTQASKTARQMTKAVNPKNQALWQLPDLYDFLCSNRAQRGEVGVL